MQVLLLMYRRSKDVSLRKVFPCYTRESTRFVVKTDMKVHKRSPYYVGACFFSFEYFDSFDHCAAFCLSTLPPRRLPPSFTHPSIGPCLLVPFNLLSFIIELYSFTYINGLLYI